MSISKFDARDISPIVARFFAVMAPAILPGAWGGMVPPITIPGRHKKIDEYLRKTAWAQFQPGTVLLDVGCGFPPQTAMDAAEAFPDWQIVGVDPAFEDYLVYDEHGNYASISKTDDSSGRVRYFQPVPQHFLTLFADRNATIRKFEETFARLLADLPGDEGALASVERDGARLVRHPMKQYERPNLKFIQAGFGSEDVPRADLIRAFNVLLYYDEDFRRMAEEWAAKVIRSGGLLICGRDDAASLNAHYTVYRNENGCMIEKEFAFGVELVRQPAWYTVHEGDRETWRLAKLIGMLRSDREFLHDYDVRLDGLLAEHKFNMRDENRCLIDHPEAGDPAQRFPSYLAITDALQKEFTDRAVVALTRAGINAWRNPVGHVAVTPMPVI
jgi:hypothetical protein